MGNHYSDYLKKNVSVKDLVFDEIREKDKALLKRVKKAHIKSNMGFLVIFSIGFIACTYFFTAFLMVSFSLLQERWKIGMEETLLTSIFSISTWKTKTNLS